MMNFRKLAAMLKSIPRKTHPKAPRAEIITQAEVFWGELYGRSLFDEDAWEIIGNVAGFFGVLSEWDEAERNRQTSSRDADIAQPATMGRRVK
jgi:hypothetical protein